MADFRVRARSWISRRPVALSLTVVVGMGIGALVYYASRLDGVALCVVTGGVTAAFGVLVWVWLTRSTSVTEVEVTVPQFSKVKFAVTKDHRVMARRIVVQMVTRVAIRPLPDDTGRADEAIASLHSLFLFVRDLVDDDATSRPTPGRPQVDVLAMNMLTRHLGPFLSAWHRRYGDWRAANEDRPESEWPEDQRFRAELRELQAHLRPQAVAFATMAEFDGYLDVIGLSA